MKTLPSFSTVIVCLIFLFLMIPLAGAQETEVAEDQEVAENQETAEDQETAQEDRIAAETEMLEAKIAELEEKPIDYFGSQKNKRTRIGFYRYRLEMLLQDPDKYFSEPEEFEGNIKTPE